MSAYRNQQARRFSEFVAGRQNVLTDRLFREALTKLLSASAPSRPVGVRRARTFARLASLGSRRS